LGVAGVISASNSLVGTHDGDLIGNYGIAALANGNYVVNSPVWRNASIANAGAVTWVDGNAGLAGPLSSTNSLVGTTPGDLIGSLGITPLSNGNYVVDSPYWDKDVAATDVGAATWADGNQGISGSISASNSLVGTLPDARVGINGITALSNGNYVVDSPFWGDGSHFFVGAVTWANGGHGLSGPVSTLNSLIGALPSDEVGTGGITAVGNGDYVVGSPFVDNGFLQDAGAITPAYGDIGLRGQIFSSNSVFGAAADGGSRMVFDFDPAREQLVVGQPVNNRITLLPLSIFANGFD
jgi:hypothetical protein